MLYLCSLINLVKNILVKIWSNKVIRVLLCVGFAYYLGSGFYDKMSARLSSASFPFLGWDTIFSFPEINYNPNFTKSNKNSYGIMASLTTLGSVMGPGFAFVGIILFLQKVWNTYKAPPLPIIYNAEDAEDVLVADYRMPTLYTKGEDWNDDDEEEQSFALQEEGAST